MSRTPTRSIACAEPATRPRLRLAALFLMVAAVAACTGVPVPDSVPTHGIVCLAPARPAVPGGCIVRDAATGITLRVTDAYADVTRTVVQLETTNADSYPLGIMNDLLALHAGPILQDIGGSSSGGPVALLDVEPLPPDDIGRPVELVASSHVTPPMFNGLYPPTLPPSPPWLNQLDRLSLSVPFLITPAGSGGFTYHQAPVVEQGIGVQIESLDLSPFHPAFYGTAGGARLVLRFTGLPADMELLSFVLIQSQSSIGGGTFGDSGPGQVQLTIPGMTVSTPAMTLPQQPTTPADPGNMLYPTVGSAGTVVLEVSYQGSGVPTGQPAAVTISDIALLTGGEDATTALSAPSLPTYQITLPLHSVL